MTEDWFDVAYINFDEAILHGRMTSGIGADRVRIEKDVRKVLSADERSRIEALESRHQHEMQKLFRSMAA